MTVASRNLTLIIGILIVVLIAGFFILTLVSLFSTDFTGLKPLFGPLTYSDRQTETEKGPGIT
jgi:uncharacterized membrane protein (DUF373 family)